MSSKRRYSLSETRAVEHLKLLEQLETMPMVDSCCDICHCDCYNTHHIETDECCFSRQAVKDCKKITGGFQKEVANKKVKKKKCASKTIQPYRATKSKQLTNETVLPNGNSNTKKYMDTTDLRKKRNSRKRSKNIALQRSQSQCSERHYTRDCEILQDLLTSLDDKHLSNLEINGTEIKTELKETDKGETMRTSRSLLPKIHSYAYVDETDSSFVPIRLSESMANLCLAPSIKEAYDKVPDHDKRILNRMASKRSEQALAKENAWLARKYWENERYERELLKCEQMEEYKKAVRDKQFQDYLQTKARLNEIAQRDLAELQRLRESLQQKDNRTKKRLQSLRNERDLTVSQKRSEEMRKMEYINLHHEEQTLDEMIRKSETCQRLTERLRQADHIRNQMLEKYLKRLRYDNYVEQLQHEEHLREVQLNDQLKREQLKEQISRKRCRSQHFVEHKQQRNDSIRKTAKLSKSLRDIVRSSVTPEAGVTIFETGASQNVGVNGKNSSSVLKTSKALFN